MGLEKEAKQWMKERQLTTLTATYYQARACETAIFPKHQALEYLTLGLTGEAGEIANKVKKFIRDGASKDEYLAKRIEIGYEIGDVLWYCAVLAEELEMNLGHIMENNLQKLADRKKRGTLSGSGDNR
jgi:NTP pyrophosphatase (non-canonical NTP hydrolase)